METKTTTRYVTLPLAGGVYFAKASTQEPKTHIVLLEEPGYSAVEVLCKKVKTTSVLEDSTCEEAPEAATCETCAKRYRKLFAKKSA